MENVTTSQAFAFVSAGQWTREQFEEWVANKCFESYQDGVDNERENEACRQDYE